MLNKNTRCFCTLMALFTLLLPLLTGCSQEQTEVSLSQKKTANTGDPQNTDQGKAMRKSFEARQQQGH